MKNTNEGPADAERLERWKKQAESTFWGWLGCELESADDRQVTVSLTIAPPHLNMIGILHGGVHAALIDSAMGLAAMIARPEGSVVTTNLNLHYLAPAVQGRIFATAELVHQSRRTITAQATVRTDNGERLAMGTGTFRVIDPKG